MEAWCNIEYHSLAHLFGMGLSTVCVAVLMCAQPLGTIYWNGI